MYLHQTNFFADKRHFIIKFCLDRISKSSIQFFVRKLFYQQLGLKTFIWKNIFYILEMFRHEKISVWFFKAQKLSLFSVQLPQVNLIHPQVTHSSSHPKWNFLGGFCTLMQVHADGGVNLGFHEEMHLHREAVEHIVIFQMLSCSDTSMK